MKIGVFAFVLAGLLPLYAHAALTITKVMANPVGANAGRQWIQLSNTGTSTVDLGSKDIRLFTMSGNHLIKGYATGGTTLPAGTVGVIAENPMSFLVDWPSYTGMLFKSSFTLPMSGVVGIVHTDGTVLTKKSYVATPTPVSPTKPTSVSKSTTKRATRTTSATSKSKSQLKSTNTHSYGNGTLAPAAAADAAAAGAAFTLPALLTPLVPIFSTMWFPLYLALMAFSGFSLVVIQRQYYV